MPGSPSRVLALAALAALAGCVTPAATDDDSDVADTEVAAETDDTATSFGDSDLQIPGDTYRLTDDPIGPTPLDGPWSGTFTFTEIVPLVGTAKTTGTAELTIDGDAARHVSLTLTGGVWNPKNRIGRPYGPMTGIGFATLDPADLTRFRVDLAVSARNMTSWQKEGIRMVVTDDKLVIDFDDVSGLGQLKGGNRLLVEVARGELPVDTDTDTDVADTDSDTDTDTDVPDTDTDSDTDTDTDSDTDTDGSPP